VYLLAKRPCRRIIIETRVPRSAGELRRQRIAEQD